MSEEFKVEIVNPEKSFLSKENVTEVVVPAFEGEMGILKDHISIISFLKPGIIKVYSKSLKNFNENDFISLDPETVTKPGLKKVISGICSDKIVISPSKEGIVTDFTFSLSKIFSGEMISKLKSCSIYAAASFAIFSALATASSIVPTI